MDGDLLPVSLSESPANVIVLAEWHIRQTMSDEGTGICVTEETALIWQQTIGNCFDNVIR
jgi:hypothetical protein